MQHETVTSLQESDGSVRDPLTDHLLTLQNSALAVIDYQPSQPRPLRRWTPSSSSATSFLRLVRPRPIAVVTELFRDWASPFANRRATSSTGTSESPNLSSEVGVEEAEKLAAAAYGAH